METEEQGSGGSGADTSTSSDSFILPRRRGRKLERMTYLDFGKVFEVFPELDTDVLCKLGCDTGSPNRVEGKKFGMYTV